MKSALIAILRSWSRHQRTSGHSYITHRHYATGRPDGAEYMIDPHRLCRPYLNELFDSLWQIRRGSFSKVENKLLLIDAPRTILTCRAWTEFVDDGLVGTWAKQMIRPDVLAFLKPPSRLASIMVDMAKVLNPNKQDQRDNDLDVHARIKEEDVRALYRLLDEMNDMIFVKRSQTPFKYVSTATEALGYYSLILNASEDTVANWSTILHDWIKSGRLSNTLSSALDRSKATEFGLTTVTGFMGGLARLKYKPPEHELQLLAAVTRDLISKSMGTRFLTAKGLLDCVRSWHAWRLNPKTLCADWWSVWFKGYEDALQRHTVTAQASRMLISGLVQTALLTAKDFGTASEMRERQAITEEKLTQLIDAGLLSIARADSILKLVNALHKDKMPEERIFSDKMISALTKLAGKS